MLPAAIRRQLIIYLTLIIAFALGCLASVQAATDDSGAAAVPSGTTAGDRSGDTIWLISTRHLPCPCCSKSDDPDFQVLRYAIGQGWDQSSIEQFDEAESPAGTTAIFVHGNQGDWSRSKELGLIAYRGLTRTGCDDRPLRFVVYSWPSDRIACLVRDVRVKAERADGECCYLAYLLNRMQPETRVGLFGFSFGSRIIAGALHVNGGGELHGFCRSEQPAKPADTLRAVLMGAAMHNYWLLPGRRFGESVSHVDALLVQYNSCDRALRHYSAVDRRTRPQALGHTGVPCFGELGEDGERVAQQDVCRLLGKRHSAESYLYSETVMSQARPYLVW